MKFDNESKEEYYKFDIDLSDEEAEFLIDVGLREIKKDSEALINYAVNFILQKKVDELKQQEQVLKEKIKNQKN